MLVPAQQTDYVYATMPSPVGTLTLIGGERGLAAVLWESERPNRVRAGATKEDRNHPVLLDTRRQLGEYFAGTRTSFDLELDFHGTDFQKRVWNELLRIPYGETRTYGEIAKQLGNANAMRAVGAANGRNPISIIAPCHRVIGASGDLTGFAGGLSIKARLLELESTQLSLLRQSGDGMSKANTEFDCEHHES
jgi:methylated-DNA-[protein]-cysteine S-methyltransferase